MSTLSHLTDITDISAKLPLFINKRQLIDAYQDYQVEKEKKVHG